MLDILVAKEGRFTVAFDRLKGIAVADLVGFWSIEDAVDYRPAMAEAVAASRAYHGRAFVLFDLTQSQTMSGSLFDDHEEKGTNFLEAGDEVAIVLVSSLLRLQTRRMKPYAHENRYFTSRGEAEAWLEDRLKNAA